MQNTKEHIICIAYICVNRQNEKKQPARKLQIEWEGMRTFERTKKRERETH